MVAVAAKDYFSCKYTGYDRKYYAYCLGFGWAHSIIEGRTGSQGLGYR
jgi:hypothetical protein